MVTITEVARHAGVAPSTVFYVLTGKRSISSRTRERVCDSIAELGYRQPADVQALRPDQPDVVALVLPLPDVHLPMVARLVTSLAAAARGRGMDLLLVADLAGFRRAAGNSRVNGFLVLDSDDAGERLRLLTDLGRPSVLIGPPMPGVTCVDLDFETAGARCVEHLADLGHRNIGFLGAPSSRAQRTLAGFTAAAMRRGVVGTALGRIDLLPAHPAVTALVLHDECAAVQVPQDMTVVDVCGGVTTMSLASVELSERDLGTHAVDLLLTLAGGGAPPPLTLVPPRLVRHRFPDSGGRHDR